MASPQRDPPILFLGALWREVAGIASLLEKRSTLPAEAGRAVIGERLGQRVIVAAGGVGRKRVLALAREVLGLESPTTIVNVGFAAALVEGLGPASLVLAETILHNGGEVAPSSSLTRSADRILQGAPIRFRKGRLLTVGRPVRRAAEKLEEGRKWSAVAVDMEAYHLAELGRDLGIPFLCVKVISDDVEKDLPEVTPLLSPAGRASLFRTLLYLLRRPREIGGLISLARADRQGRVALAEFAAAFLGARGEKGPA